MKLKYYMRGLGIGIILTTLIFTFINNEKKLSDEEIIRKAKALGMVTEDERNANLEQVLHNNKPTGISAEPTSNPEVSPSVTPSIAPDLEDTITPTPGLTQEPTEEPTKQPTKMPEPLETTNEVRFTIEQGMTSSKVADLLLDVGLIDNSGNFNDYLIMAGKASVIRVGSYSIPKDATYDEITKMITSR